MKIKILRERIAEVIDIVESEEQQYTEHELKKQLEDAERELKTQRAEFIEKTKGLNRQDKESVANKYVDLLLNLQSKVDTLKKSLSLIKVSKSDNTVDSKKEKNIFDSSLSFDNKTNQYVAFANTFIDKEPYANKYHITKERTNFIISTVIFDKVIDVQRQSTKNPNDVVLIKKYIYRPQVSGNTGFVIKKVTFAPQGKPSEIFSQDLPPIEIKWRKYLDQQARKGRAKTYGDGKYSLNLGVDQYEESFSNIYDKMNKEERQKTWEDSGIDLLHFQSNHFKDWNDLKDEYKDKLRKVIPGNVKPTKAPDKKLPTRQDDPTTVTF